MIESTGRLRADTGVPARIERTVVRAKTVAVWHLGGACYVVKTPKALIYLDPYVGQGDSTITGGRAIPIAFDPLEVRLIDAVICSHDHEDHTDPQTLAAWRDHLRPPVLGPQASIQVARELGYPEDRLHALEHGMAMTINDVKITAVKMFDPLAAGTNGHVLEAEGITLLHCGDSLYFPEIGDEVAAWNIDAIFVSVAHNPRGKNWYMTEVDAARAARDTNAATLVPGHWDIWQNFRMDPRRVRVAVGWYCPEVAVRIPRFTKKMLFRSAHD